MIDRPLRPLFPEGFYNEVQIIPTVLNFDTKTPPDIAGINASSLALCLSDIPFLKPVGAVRVAYINNEYIFNPTIDEIKQSDLDLIVAGTETAITMIEGDCLEFPEDQVIEVIEKAHEVIKEIIELQLEIVKIAGKPKKDIELAKENESLSSEIKGEFFEKIKTILAILNKQEREDQFQEIVKTIKKKTSTK